MRRSIFWLSITSVSMLFFMACEETPLNTVSPEDSTAAVAAVNAANAELETLIDQMITTMDNMDSLDVNAVEEALDFTTAYNRYEEAVGLDPRNTQANFGSALTGLLQITNNQDFRDLIDRWDAYFTDNIPFVRDLPGNTLGKRGYGMPMDIRGLPAMAGMHVLTAPLNLAKIAVQDIPQMSELQDIVENSFIPIINTALARLEVVEGDSAFVFSITGPMQGDSEAGPLELDLTEVYVVDMALRVVNTTLQTVVAYNFDVATHDSAGMIAALSQNSAFLTLRANGSSNLQKAIMDARTAVLKAQLGLDFLEAETDNQDDDLIVLDNTSSGDVQNIRNTLSDIQNALNGPSWVYWDNWHEEYIDGQWYEYTTPDSLRIDPSRMFDHPISDLKQMLPPYTVTTGLDTLSSWSYQDIPANFATDSLVWPSMDYLPPNYGGNAHINVSYQYYGNGDYYLYATVNWANLATIQFDSLEQLVSPDYPLPIQELGASILAIITENTGQNLLYQSLSFYWYGAMYTGQPLTIDGWIYYETEIQDKVLTYPILTWEQNSYSEWKNAWPDPTFNGVFPDWDIDGFLNFMGMTESDWHKILDPKNF